MLDESIELYRIFAGAAMAFAYITTSCATPQENKVTPSIEILALSRGRGVPDATRAAIERMRTVLAEKRSNGTVVDTSEVIFGLEGETRICVTLRDTEALEEVLSALLKIGENVDLIEIHERACRPQ